MLGSTEVVSALDLDGATGIAEQTVVFSKAAADSELGIRFNTEAADGGKLRIFAEYIVSE